MRLILALALVLTLALGALTASAADPRYQAYGPFPGYSTNADAAAVCLAQPEGYTGGIVRNYRDGNAGRVHTYLCVLPEPVQ